MSSLKHLRSRIKSVKSTQKITKAIQVVSAAKLRWVKDDAESSDEYLSNLLTIMNDISSSINFIDLNKIDKQFFQKDLTDKPCLFVVVTSEKGLCGSLNSQIIRAVKRDIIKFTKKNIKITLIVIGKKGYDALKNCYSDIIEEYYPITKEKYSPVILQIKDKIIKLIQQDEIGSCRLYYNEFKNTLTQIMTSINVFPIKQLDQEQQENNEIQSSLLFKYEGPSLINSLINSYTTGVMKHVFLHNKASEEAARMTAMNSATRNAGELIDKLTLKLNRSRQEKITTELTEIISGTKVL